MKKIKILFLFATLIIYFSQQIKSQAYQPLLEDNKSWDVLYWSGCENNPICCYGGGNRYVINGDTLINSKIYKKIYSYGILRDTTVPQPYYCPSSLVDTIGYPLHVFLREDTVLKKVYYYDINSTYTSCSYDNEVLLYDFNYLSGDTVKCIVASGVCNYICIVENITFELFNGIYRKTIHFFCSGAGYYQYVEGLGGVNTGGLFNSVFIEGGYQLECVQKDGINLYNYYCRNFISDVPDAKNEIQSINVIYNSSNRTITVNNIKENENIILYNSLGIELINIKPVTNEAIINAGNIKNGCYILKSDNFYKKIIIY